MSVEQSVGLETEHDPAHPGLERQMHDVARRLQLEFPEIGSTGVHTLLREALEITRHARVQHFRSLLAERTVREQLRRRHGPRRR